MSCWINPAVCIPAPLRLVWREGINSVPFPLGRCCMADAPVPSVTIPRAPLGSGRGCCPWATGQAGHEPQWAPCRCSHACPQCCLPGRCCSGLLCSPCLRVMLCHEMFSATLPATGRRTCAVLHPWAARRPGGRQRSQGISLVGLAASFLLEAKPSRNECK